MNQRYVSIWFRHLKTDWHTRQNHQLKNKPFVLACPDHGRMRITEVSVAAKKQGIEPGMVVADAKVMLPALQIIEDDPTLAVKLLKKLGVWAIRYTPEVAIDPPNGLLLHVTGCTHLWQGEERYLKDIAGKLKALGYQIRLAIADTMGTAWAIARYGTQSAIIEPGKQKEALLRLPPAALRPEAATLERLHKLGLHYIGSFINMAPAVLRRRFGEPLVSSIRRALGETEENMEPLMPPQPYEERLPCLEPIQTRKGIEIALEKLLKALCLRLYRNGQGIRTAHFKGFRVDGECEEIHISTNLPAINGQHLFKLFEIKLEKIEPAAGIELFMLTATKTGQLLPLQQSLWTSRTCLQTEELARLLDHVEGKFGKHTVRRYLPAEHHMPERSIQPANSLTEEPSIEWRTGRRRPIVLLPRPHKIAVTAPVPDYPPMNFQYRGKLHKVVRADGPERIEPEWWLEKGLHRDYYVAEDEEGSRYWLFRLGHYGTAERPQWFLHGFFE